MKKATFTIHPATEDGLQHRITTDNLLTVGAETVKMGTETDQIVVTGTDQAAGIATDPTVEAEIGLETGTGTAVTEIIPGIEAIPAAEKDLTETTTRALGQAITRKTRTLNAGIAIRRGITDLIARV